MHSLQSIREILQQAQHEFGTANQWPVDLLPILAKLGIGLRFVPSSGRPGAAYLCIGESVEIIVPYWTGTQPRIGVKERFSLAHELAHYVLWRDLGLLPSSNRDYWEHESLCNEFAAAMLVPDGAIRRFVESPQNQHLHAIYFPGNLAIRGVVSWDVAARSLTQSVHIDAAYLRLEPAKSSKTTDPPATRTPYQVACSSLKNPSGSFVGQSAKLRDLCMTGWISNLCPGVVAEHILTVDLGQLHLREVPASFLLTRRFCAVHFHASHPGVLVQEKVRKGSTE